MACAFSSCWLRCSRFPWRVRRLPRRAATDLAPGGKWISGDFLQQTGLNCSTAILGEPYTEVMVSGSASYGGLPRCRR